MLIVDRTAVPADYEVLPLVPLPTATETLTWCTRVFIAADLSESRQSLADYPAITIDYEFVLKPSTQSFLDTLSTAKPNWLVPFFPHYTRATFIPAVLRGVIYGPFARRHSFGSPAAYYPYQTYCVVYDRTRMVYCLTGNPAPGDSDLVLSAPSTFQPWTEPLFVAPAFVAQLQPQIRYVDVGDCRWGSRVGLTFRMSAEAEQALTYHVDDFDFISVAETPLNVSADRRQADYMPKPAPAHAYVPVAYQEDQTPMINTSYFLTYHESVRDDYYFRGAMMRRLGGYTADNYITNTKQHRLADDTVAISYDLGRANAAVTMRQVTN